MSAQKKYTESQQDSTGTAMLGDNAIMVKRMYMHLHKESPVEGDSRETMKYQVMVEPGGKRANSRSQSRTPTSQKDANLLGPIFETCRSVSSRSHKSYRRKEIGTRSGLQNSAFGRFMWPNRSEQSSPAGMSVESSCKPRRQNRSGKPSKAWWRAHAKWLGSDQIDEDQYTDVVGAIQDIDTANQDRNADDVGSDPSVNTLESLDTLSGMPPTSPIKSMNIRGSVRQSRSVRQSTVGGFRAQDSGNSGKFDRRTMIDEARKTLEKAQAAGVAPGKSIRFHGSIIEEEESKPEKPRRTRVHSVCLEWKGGVLVPQTPQERLREDVKLMEKKMQDSMQLSFDKAVWEECGLQQKVKVTVNDRPDVSFMYELSESGVMRNMHRRRTRAVQETMEMEKDELMIASLAKKTGMSVLDVEEIWEVFQKYDIDGEGRINIDGPAFELLIIELGQDPKTSEVIKMREDLDISVDGCADFVDFYLVFMSYLSTNRKL
eukprot:gnl/MRDRNA2_/MRDRNA2_93074_c0_seq1.p1 gnl/MRDRNA2_/MRDRNA2_93074_c0~~gnl/MRDRNA2_/MRDRNA2_93074_c0_seq1.p1  ORF type:complete len:488 (-),score=81.93 gnl/MRDRNA2_/MRDRNA2_93074_c0_seq1:4-1467(-)